MNKTKLYKLIFIIAIYSAALEDKIATLEADFSKYASDFVKLNELTKEKEAAEQQLEEKMERWMYLEDLAARIAEQ